MTDLPMRDKFGGGQSKSREGRKEAGPGDRLLGAAGGARVGRNFVPSGGEKGEDEGGGDGGKKMKKGEGFGMQDDRRRRRSKGPERERKRKGAMGIMGDNGDGYQLAMRLENSGVWREWLGPGWYSKIVPHLASSGTWRDFMMNTLATPLGFQMRVRALLFDKAASCLVSAESDDEAVDLAISPTSVAPSFLQLHADGIYCSLEQDAEDWKRLQTEGSPISSLVGKHDRNPVDSTTGIKQEASDTRGQSVNFAQQRQPPRPVQNLPSLVSPKQEGSRPSLSKVKKVEAWDNVDAKRSIEGVGTISKKLRSPKISSKPPAFQGDTAVNRDQGIDKVAIAKSPQSCVSTSDDPRHSATGGARAISTEAAESLGLWYDKCMDKAVGDRMRRVAHRSSQQNLPFEKREAVVRTAEGMAAYIEQFSDRKMKISPARALDATVKEPKAASLKVKTEASVESRTDASVSQDFKFLANSVPDNAVPAPKKRRHLNSHSTSSGVQDRFDLPLPSTRGVDGGSGRPQGQTDTDSAVNLDSGSSRSSRSAGQASVISEQMSQVLTQKVVAQLVSGAGFEGLKQSSMDFMCDLLERHLWKLGSALRSLADNYSKPGSQTEILRLFIQRTGASVEDLVQHVNAGSGAALQMGTPVAGQTGTAASSLGAPNVPTQKRRPAPTQQAQQGLVSPQALDNPVRQQQGHQPVSEKASKRRQSSNLGRNKRAEKDKSGNEGKAAAEHSDLSRIAGRELMPMQISPRLNPQTSTWHPQPPLVQSPLGSVLNYKQQLPSLQLPSVPP